MPSRRAVSLAAQGQGLDTPHRLAARLLPDGHNQCHCVSSRTTERGQRAEPLGEGEEPQRVPAGLEKQLAAWALVDQPQALAAEAEEPTGAQARPGAQGSPFCLWSVHL